MLGLADTTHLSFRSRRIAIWSRVRANDLDSATGPGMNQQPKAVQLRDRGHQIEAKANSRRAPRLLRTIETPQHDLTLLLADAGPAVGDTHDGTVVAPRQFEAHFAAFGGELDGVVNEVGDRLE